MTTTLSEGVKVPDVGSVNWAGDLEVNWNLLNGALANLSGNVKLDRDNTWTGEQSFTLPIVGSITGTASKAIADEDGTSIKSGYVNVAGNQTVTGQKTWSGNQFFTSAVYHKSTTYEIGNFPASNIVTNIYFADKNNVYTGFTRSVIYASGRTATELRAKNLFKNSVLDPTGSEITSSLNVEVQPDGTKSLYFDGSIRNNVLPYTTNAYSLGSSSYQWSSVYAQSYYYNGTAWGLDQANVWSGYNTYTNVLLTLKHTTLAIGELPTSNQTRRYRFTDKNNVDLGWVQHRVNTLGESYIELFAINNFDNSQLSPQGTAVASSFAIGVKGDGTRFANIMSDLYPASTNTYNLGTSTNKWKTLNGINPGALSLPDVSNAVSIDTTDWDKTGNLISYTPPVDGWISIVTDNSSAANYIRCVYDNGDFLAKANGNGYAQGLSVFLPVPKNTRVGIRLVCTTIGTAKLYPCLGNV